MFEFNFPMQPKYSSRERLADNTVHFVGVIASIAAVATLMGVAVSSLPHITSISLAIYGCGMLIMFVASATYNLMRHTQWREILRRLDHAAIFVMIAGTYTPFSLVKIGGIIGPLLFAVVWIVAIVGMVLKLQNSRRFDRLLLALYLVQGWAVLVAIGPLVTSISTSALLLLGIGGFLYSVGVIFYLWKKLPFHNAIWHLFVLLGASCHFAAVMGSVALS